MFCRYCGKELMDTAFVCPACGSLVGKLPPEYEKKIEEEKKQQQADVFFGHAPQPQAAQPVEPSRKDKVFCTLSKVFSIIGFVFSGIAAFCLMLAFFGGIGMMNSSGDTGAVSFVFGWIYAIICGVAAAEMGIAAFVFGRIQKQSETQKKQSTLAFIFGLVVCASSIFFIFTPFFYY